MLQWLVPLKRLVALNFVLLLGCRPVPPHSENPSDVAGDASADLSHDEASTDGGGDAGRDESEAPLPGVPTHRSRPAGEHALANGARVDCPEEAQCRPIAAQNQMIVEYDHDDDGAIDQRNLYTYDEHGGITRMEIDAEADGTAEQTIITRRTYDARGNVLTDETDMDGDGVIDRRSWHTYDASDRMLTWTYDAANAHGRSFRGHHVRRINPRTGQELTSACDGVPDIRRTNVYDNEGNLLRTEVDFEVDGTVDQVIRYEPPCPPPYGTDTCPDYVLSIPSSP